VVLNLMRPSNVNPLVSAYETLFGKFISKNTPVASPGTEVMILERSEDRLT
jgi:hypothetical protein